MWRSIFWWCLCSVCLIYAAYAFNMGFLELGLLLDGGVPGHEHPVMFSIHALGGAMALIAGPLQFSDYLRRRYLKVHRVIGYAYVVGIYLSSVTAVFLLMDFEVSIISRGIFIVLALLWFSTTTTSLVYIKQRQINRHQQWMIRSFALSLFFVSFSLWVPLMQTVLPEPVGYPLGIFISWAGNLVLAELRIAFSGKTNTVADTSTGTTQRIPL